MFRNPGADAVARRLLPGHLIEMTQPFHLAAPFGEGIAETKPVGEVGKDIEIVARASNRRDRLMHGEHVAVGRRRDVVTFERRGRREHDVGLARGGRPPDFVDDHRFGTLPRREQGD